MSDALHEFSLAASAYTVYPAEVISYRLRPVLEPGAGSACITLPAGLQVEHFALQGAAEQHQLYATESENSSQINWEWDEAGVCGELVIDARASRQAASGVLVCQASQLDGQGHLVADMELCVTLKRQADSMNYLPEIYAADDFTNRFMMLFESFWKPISQQIDQVSCYFDPYLTTPEMLPWLAGWFGLEWDEALSVERKRDLLARIFPIYAHKGTAQALELFLKMFTGGEVEITEHRDTNFVLGTAAYLGYQIALGTGNAPHSFDVHLRVPPGSVQDEKLAREQYRQRVEAMISKYKPAHTVFHLDLQFA
jgi:phage tail-like protein